MLDHNPILKQRLMAFAAFGGIGLFAVSAVNLMVSGGFDFGGERADYYRVQPSAYVRVVDAANYVGDSFRAIALDEPRSVDIVEPEASETVDAPLEATSSSDDLAQQIASLYERGAAQADEPDYYDARATEDEPAYEEEPIYSDETDVEADEIASAYENESPW